MLDGSKSSPAVKVSAPSSRSFRVGERGFAGLLIILFASGFSLAMFLLPGQLRLLEVDMNDRIRILAPPHSAEQDRRISIVTLTEETLVQFPYRSPVDRGFLATLVTALADAGAKALVLDLLFDQPTEPEKDRALARAIREFPGPVVAAWGDQNAGLIKQQLEYLTAFENEAELKMGFANVITDPDGVVRRFVTRLPGTDRFSMPAVAAQRLAGVTLLDGGLIDWVIASSGATVFQTLPAHVVNQLAKAPAMQARLKDWLSGRVVFVGADLEQRDRHQTSMSVDPTSDRTIPGVLIQAHILAQLLDGRQVPNASTALVVILTATLAILGAAIGLSQRGLIYQGVGAVTITFVYSGILFLLAREQVYYLPVLPPLFAMVLSLGLAIWMDSYLTHRAERYIRMAFSHYLEPSMVDQLASDPNSLRLGGERREMSLLFSDIQGFTQMAEDLAPDELTRMLNNYFDGVSEIIIKHGGAIDKFIGDAVVAHFGAPAVLSDHALKAVQCAAELDDFAEEFRRAHSQLGLGVTRIGVHSGTATVGNFGGRSRFDYTAMGDAVNTASRLESCNKVLGTRVSISEDTARMASGMAGPGDKLPLFRTVGEVMLAGKSKPLVVYTIENNKDEDFVYAYESALALTAVDVGKATEAFELLCQRQPNDPLLKLHLKRLKMGNSGVMQM